MKKNSQVILYLVLTVVVMLLVVQTVVDINKENKVNTPTLETFESGEEGTQNQINKAETIEWQNYFASKISILKEEYPHGKYWNVMEDEEGTVTNKPCNHDANGNKYCNLYAGKSNDAYPYAVTGRQSVGFASLLSDAVFGKDAEAYSFSEYEKVRIGDQARIDADTHTVFIIEKTDEYIIVAEANEDGNSCLIEWGRKIMKSSLKGALYISRYE